VPHPFRTDHWLIIPIVAALSDAGLPRVVDLRQLRAEDLQPLLAEEIEEWQEKLDWDFRGSGELVERFVTMHALAGYGLITANRVAGYVYYVCEERKGLIGDLYIMRRYRTEASEDQLLRPVLETLTQSPWVRRVEAQLMMLGHCFDRPMPMADKLTLYPRTFMEVPLDGIETLPAKGRVRGLSYRTWEDRHQDDAARVIAAAYRGHIDSDINDQYRSPAGARRFLLNIVQYPGCGAFFQPASQVAVVNHRVCGISLASLVRSDVGHITQICVGPEVRGAEVGYELLRRSLVELRKQGCRKVTLTVTTANETAIHLYRRMGFIPRRSFAAFVWDRL
jgi:ribosomal protein S18 acetylase RimI-like enzyme